MADQTTEQVPATVQTMRIRYDDDLADTQSIVEITQIDDATTGKRSFSLEAIINDADTGEEIGNLSAAVHDAEDLPRVMTSLVRGNREYQDSIRPQRITLLPDEE